MVRLTPACKALMEVSGPPGPFKPFSRRQTVALQGRQLPDYHFNFLLPGAGVTKDTSAGSEVEPQVAFPPVTSLLMVLDIQGPGLATTSLPTGCAYHTRTLLPGFRTSQCRSPSSPRLYLTMPTTTLLQPKSAVFEGYVHSLRYNLDPQAAAGSCLLWVQAALIRAHPCPAGNRSMLPDLCPLKRLDGHI